MPNLRLINLNAAGGALVNVLSSIPARYAEFIEDESVTPQGLVYQVRKTAFPVLTRLDRERNRSSCRTIFRRDAGTVRF